MQKELEKRPLVSATTSRRKKTKLGWLDAVLIAAVIGFVWSIDHRIRTEIVYHWNWSALGDWFAWRDEEGVWHSNLLLNGLFSTIRLFLWSSVLAIVLGTVLGMMRTVPQLFLRLMARSYVELVRNLPPLVFLFIFYFFVSAHFLPLLGFTIWIDALKSLDSSWSEVLFGPAKLRENMLSGVICLALFEAAYFCEILRGGIEAVPKAQWDAARAIGLPARHVWGLIVLPQALRNILPAMTGQLITVVKDSTIVSIISVQELAFAAQEVAVSTERIFEVWIIIACMFFVLCYSLSILAKRLERRLARGRDDRG